MANAKLDGADLIDFPTHPNLIADSMLSSHGSAPYPQGSAPNIACFLLRSTKGAAGTNNFLIIS